MWGAKCFCKAMFNATLESSVPGLPAVQWNSDPKGKRLKKIQKALRAGHVMGKEEKGTAAQEVKTPSETHSVLRLRQHLCTMF